MAPKKENHKKAAPAAATSQYAHLSDDELLNTAPEFLSGQALLRLAHSYTEREIFDRMNTVRPNSVKRLNNIQSRVWYAMKVASKASGRTMEDIREEVTKAREKKDTKQVEETNLEHLNLDKTAFTASQSSVRFSHALAPK